MGAGALGVWSAIGATGKREGTPGRSGYRDRTSPTTRDAAGMEDQPLTLGEVLDELAFSREWRAEHTDAVELAGLSDARPEEQ
jgi:hypothetical protein